MAAVANFIGRAPAAFGGERSAFRKPGSLLALSGGATSTALATAGARSYQDDAWSAQLASGCVFMSVGGGQVKVDIDPEKGPVLLLANGGIGYLDLETKWPGLKPGDQKVAAYKAATKNRSAAEARATVEAEMAAKRQQEAAAEAARKEKEAAEAAVRQRELDLEAVAKAGQESPDARILARCKMEMNRPPIFWSPIGPDLVKANHTKRGKGIFYGLEFPWNADLLVNEFGAEWLTKAFHATGALNKDNRVTEVIRDATKIDAGNNAGKFLFEVKYAKPSPDLDEKLFAKIPFSMNMEQLSDRISSSVYKQPMDMMEINTYRLVEGLFPMRTPKFYFGDISQETSNFILISARIPFAEMGGRKSELEPFAVEGPYDKCKDYQLRGDAKEYYTLLVRTSATIAGYHKAGKFGSDEFLAMNLSNSIRADPKDPMAWGVNPAKPTGDAPADTRRKLDAAYKFISDTASALYPDYVKEKAFEDKFVKTMMKWSAYAAEVNYFKHNDMDYVALGHQNLNADNAYFWRDDKGKLDCGLLDWGGFGNSCVGHKMWWCFNCADFDQVRDNLPHYINTFVGTYKETGGPSIDFETLEMMVLLTVLENTSFMVKAVPNCFKMCPARDFATIKDRHDPRIADNIHGKSTLRTTIHVMLNGVRAIQELEVDKMLDKFIKEVYVGRWGCPEKTDAIINGA